MPWNEFSENGTVITRYANDGSYVGVVSYESAVHEEGLDGSDTLTVTGESRLAKRERLVWRDPCGEWREHIVDRSERDHSKGRPTVTSTCSNSISELFGVPIELDEAKDERAEVGKVRGTVQQLLNRVLRGTRWEAGKCSSFGGARYELEIWHKSVRECVTELVDLCAGELVTKVSVGGYGVEGRSASIVEERGSDVTCRQFTWGRNMGSAKRTVGSEDVYTAVVGYGKKLLVTELESDLVALEPEDAAIDAEQGAIDKVQEGINADQEPVDAEQERINAEQQSINEAAAANPTDAEKEALARRREELTERRKALTEQRKALTERRSALTERRKALAIRRNAQAARRRVINEKLKAARENDYLKRLTVKVDSDEDRPRWGTQWADGKLHNTWATYTDDECDDADFLREQCEKQLAVLSKPLVRYEFEIHELDADMWKGARLGDRVSVVDDDLGADMIERVSHIRRTLSGRLQCRIAIGERANPLVEKFKAVERVSKATTGNTSRAVADSPVTTSGSYGSAELYAAGYSPSSGYSSTSGDTYASYGSGDPYGSGSHDGWAHQVNGVTLDNGVINFVTEGA